MPNLYRLQTEISLLDQLSLNNKAADRREADAERVRKVEFLDRVKDAAMKLRDSILNGGITSLIEVYDGTGNYVPYNLDAERTVRDVHTELQCKVTTSGGDVSHHCYIVIWVKGSTRRTVDDKPLRSGWLALES